MQTNTCIALLLLATISCLVWAAPQYNIGTGMFDITGPAADANMMGMANLAQITKGIQLRLYARAFAFSDPADTTRLVYVSADLAFIPGGITEAVIGNLTQYFHGPRYSYENVMISATHTHSGPGGYSTETLYDLTSFGFIKKNFEAIVQGIVQAIVIADSNLAPGYATITNDTLLNTNANRSPYSYTYDPEASYYPYNVDKNITVLRLENAKGTPIGMVTWFAVHGTSMNNTNMLISGDNKGFASWFVERQFNPDSLPGQGSFVAAFGQCNEGDVSPNINGALCPDGTPCDPIHSTCNGRVEGCIAGGPGKDMDQSCQIIGQNQANKALQMWDVATTPVSGPLVFRHSFINFENVSVSAEFSSTGKNSTTCLAALGDSFAAGTTDGPGAFNFVQGTNSTTTNPIWNQLGHLLSEPTREQKQCQYPKPILLNVGGIHIPEKAPWAASVLPLQIFRIGQLFIVGVPGEFTTCSGRRLLAQVRATMEKYGAADANSYFVVGGLANEYTHYITTPQEYNIQRYEAASTLYGPETLSAYLQEYTNIAKALATNVTLPTLAPPTYNFTLRLFPEWEGDEYPAGKPFGTVLKDVLPSYQPGQLVSVEFQGANPRNDYRINSTFLTVELLTNAKNNTWQVVMTDADWETTYNWDRDLESPLQSLITLKWGIPNKVLNGTYRMRYFGNAKNMSGAINPISGTSSTFTVTGGTSLAPGMLEKMTPAEVRRAFRLRALDSLQSEWKEFTQFWNWEVEEF